MNKEEFIKVDNSNFIEFVCEVSDKITYQALGKKAYMIDENGGKSYSDKGQDFFNTQYDEIEYILHSILNITPYE